MFGPNTSKKISLDINFHHREKYFYDVINNIKQTIRSLFSISDDFEILIINGSGTFTMEVVISSINKLLKPIGVDGKFKKRWKDMAIGYNKFSDKGESIVVQYETSISTYNSISDENNFIVDGVCAFPFYSIPNNCSIYVTVSSKLLGSAPVLGLVFIKKTILKSFDEKNRFSTLNISNWLEYSSFNQTPYTPSIPLYFDLLETLNNFELNKLKNKIIQNSNHLVDILNPENIIGDLVGPALTIKDNIIPQSLIEKYKLYGSEVLGQKKIQIFTYSESEELYNSFFSDLKKSL